jgi:DNA polymerase-3 subunit gamma/tau
MSYQVIARKWRPQVFEDVIGQEVVTQTLRNAIEYNRLHHAYLFSGARGVGKTTTARILAKALNCHKSDKPTLTPCKADDPDICPSCIEIAESRSMDVLEIDAASHTGIDDVRETILNSIDFNPARDRYRVFIIDEVHQLSKPAFNALLKTLEEPPPNVMFVMATTELHKVPETILSRCQEFEFRTIPLQKIFGRLKFIAEAEKIDISDDALRELARSGAGSMRDAQSNFDQVISFSGDKITPVDVTSALGFAGVDVLTKTINAIAGRDSRAALAIVDDLISRGHDLRNFCRDLLATFRDLLVFKVAGQDGKLFDATVFSVDDMGTMAEGFTEADIVRFFNSLCDTEAALREAAHPRYVLEIGLVELIEMRSVRDVESIIERLDALSSGKALPVKSDAATAGSTAPPEKKTLKPEAVIREAIMPEPDEPEPIDEPLDETLSKEPPTVPAFTAMPVRLAPLSSIELEHIEDTKLDDAYEEKLAVTGDDLLPIVTAQRIAEKLLGVSAAPQQTVSLNGRAAAATAPAMDLSSVLPQPEENVEIPVLSDDPTEKELLAYAEAHPAIRNAKRVFRAKIVEVKRP